MAQRTAHSTTTSAKASTRSPDDASARDARRPTASRVLGTMGLISQGVHSGVTIVGMATRADMCEIEVGLSRRLASAFGATCDQIPRSCYFFAVNSSSVRIP